ncbi:MAG TPA: tryptophan synthase subunit alpha [Phycisphaerae bacterium]|nr:tryptophan synthase subunit alpha [Phycisphaerae bacterium]
MKNDRLTTTFTQARTRRSAVFCPFITAGYPRLELLKPFLRALQDAGAGCIELGIPFSDPIADGPVIQESYRVALQNGATVDQILSVVAEVRREGFDLPIMAMVSFSVIFRHGTKEFAAACAQAGIDGLILPDVALEEAPEIIQSVTSAGLKSSLLISPTTPPERQAQIAKLCTGFVYYLSVSGITGERTALPADMIKNVTSIRAHTNQPICVGFGISTPEQVRSVAQIADGIIVGSAIIRCITENSKNISSDPVAAVKVLVQSLSGGLNSREKD